MEEVKNLPANEGTVGRVLEMARAADPDCLVPELRHYAQAMLRDGYPSAQLYADLMNAHARMSGEVAEEREDAVLDTMDFLTGWCAPDARIY